MKIMRGIALGFWVVIMTGCVSLIAVYYILSQTILSPSVVKSWLNDSGVYASLAEIIVPIPETVSDTTLVTPDMVRSAARESIRPEDAKAKVEPIIDATYAWLDSKSPDITFSVSTSDLTDGFLSALEKKIVAIIETLPPCEGFVEPEEFESAGCLPSYTTSEDAAAVIMQRIQQEEMVRDQTLTPASFAMQSDSGLSKNLPSLVSYLWVAQLIAIPVFALIALSVIFKRRGGGLIAVAVSLLTPGLTLLVLGLLIHFGGAASIAAFVANSEFAAIAEPLSREIAKDFAAITMLVGGVIATAALIIGGLGVWWRRRQGYTQS